MEPVPLLRLQRPPQWPVASMSTNSAYFHLLEIDMFPGRRPTPAVEPRRVDQRKQLHDLNSDPETDKLAGLSPTADTGFRVSASFIQLIVAGSQGLTDPQAWPVSG